MLAPVQGPLVVRAVHRLSRWVQQCGFGAFRVRPPSKTRIPGHEFPGKPCPIWNLVRTERAARIRSVQNELEVWRKWFELASKPCGIRLYVPPNELEGVGGVGGKFPPIVANGLRVAISARPVPSGTYLVQSHFAPDGNCRAKVCPPPPLHGGGALYRSSAKIDGNTR